MEASSKTKEDRAAALGDVADIGAHYKWAQEQAAEWREKFVNAVKAAHNEGATQLEIANQTQYSRQRIAQFLKERETSVATEE